MNFVSPVFDLYSDYLLVNQGQTTATGLSALVEGKLSHDAITRSLHQLDTTLASRAAICRADCQPQRGAHPR